LAGDCSRHHRGAGPTGPAREEEEEEEQGTGQFRRWRVRQRRKKLKIKTLGTGCPKCKKLYAEAEKAIASSGVAADIEKVEKIDDIMKYGVMMTPALVTYDCSCPVVRGGWAALQKPLGTPAKLPVERLQIDTEGEKAAPHRIGSRSP